MIFENIDFIEKLAKNRDAYIKEFGNENKKTPYLRFFRSNMMLNPLNLKHLNRIDNSTADTITLNLEDAIAKERKEEALLNIALFLSHLKESKSFIIVRTNPFYEGGKEEIEFLNSFSFDAFRIPKVTSINEVEEALKVVSTHKELHLTVETKEAFKNIDKLKIDKRVTTLNIGILDLLTSLKLPQSLISLNNPTIDYILSKFLIDTKTASMHPISFMFQAYNDTETFKKWCEKEKLLGYESKACMGPKQVEIANSVFGVSEDEIQRALKIKKRFEKKSLDGVNGFMDNEIGLFIDEPIYRDACLFLSKK